MKNLFKIIFGALLVTTLFSSCEKDEIKAEFLGGKAPILTAST